jgi:putative colanic acid biosysnthesis UDP-glucose lipid carrier transferase
MQMTPMDKEQAHTKTAATPSPVSELILVRGGVDENLTRNILLSRLKKFARIEETSAFPFTLPLDRKFNLVIKRAADLLLSGFIILFVLSWLTPLIAILIKLDSKGPVFFLQKRNNRNGATFICIKFRTMVENNDSDTLPAHINDKRITGLGRFLRNHFLDELPQFFNVLLGDMSVIGPRPHMISDNKKYESIIDFYNDRHKVKPGITGLSQVLGYVGGTSNIQYMRDRVFLDLYYVRRWSFKLDIKIMLHTFLKFF